ncbi:MAG: methyltransferase domain-containing protein, partial [Verrucomicrobia bacterium]|nr:methyltransferase domain-containing protein [Verrucomicrobiota bacterium]
MDPRIIVTIDTECDKSPNWNCRRPLGFESVETGIGLRLQPLFASFGIRPVYFLSPEVLCHRDSCSLLRSLRDVELATHLHGDFIVPQIETWDFGGSVADDMQFEYGPELEREKLATLTEMFAQQIGARPRSFRAGRFGVSAHTGRILRDLGYVADSSITPHIAWTDKQGNRVPDFRSLPEWPYFVGAEGNLWQPGNSALLEVPVTILPAGAVPSNNAAEPVWFRPWYSDADTLCRVMDHVLSQPARTGVRRPLVMMFHNVEVVAGASPYPQTEADVNRFLDQLKRVFDHAAKRGVRACTLAEYHDELHASRNTTAPAPTRNPSVIEIQSPAKTPSCTTTAAPRGPFRRELLLPAGEVEAIIDRHQAQPWFKYVFKERANRWDVWQPCVWVTEHFPKTASVLSVGCGAGFNLFWLHEQGFHKLEGFDLDPKALAVAQEIAEKAGCPAQFWVDDAVRPRHLPVAKFD